MFKPVVGQEDQVVYLIGLQYELAPEGDELDYLPVTPLGGCAYLIYVGGDDSEGFSA